MANSTKLKLSVSRDRQLVALVGNPNAGKTTLFNALTGHRQRVGNYPGVTVEKKTGFLRGNDAKLEVLDLPGAYTLAARSADDGLVLDVLLDQQAGTRSVDLVVAVVDATNLTRNLFLTSQILEIGRPVVVAVTMVDLAESSGIRVDEEALAHELGVPVVAVIAPKMKGIDRLGRTIVDALGRETSHRCPSFPSCVCEELDGLTQAVTGGDHEGLDHGTSRIELMQTLLDPGGYHEQRRVKRCGLGLASELAERRRRLADAGEPVVEVEARVRYAWLDRVVKRVVTRRGEPRPTKSEAVDRLLTNRVVGLLVFAVLSLL